MTAAVAYLSRGWFVLPADPDQKRPLVRYKWRIRNLPTPAEWRNWARRWPDCGIGLVTGTPSGGVIVVDVDDQKAFRELRLPVPDTRIVLSANRQSPHYYWKAKSRIKSRHTPWGDIKAQGGFAMLPPSPRYRVARDLPIAQAPEWVYRRDRKVRARDPKVVYNRTLGRAKRWGVREGERVAQGCRIAFEWARNDRGPWSDACAFLLRWNHKNKPPLTNAELRNELCPKARESFDRGCAHREHAKQISERSRTRKCSPRNRVIAFLKGAFWAPTVSDIVTHTHLKAKEVRRELTRLEAGGWIVRSPKGRGHKVIWTGDGKSCKITDIDHGATIPDIKPWKPKKRRVRRLRLQNWACAPTKEDHRRTPRAGRVRRKGHGGA